MKKFMRASDFYEPREITIKSVTKMKVGEGEPPILYGDETTKEAYRLQIADHSGLEGDEERIYDVKPIVLHKLKEAGARLNTRMKVQRSEQDWSWEVIIEDAK